MHRSKAPNTDLVPPYAPSRMDIPQNEINACKKTNLPPLRRPCLFVRVSERHNALSRNERSRKVVISEKKGRRGGGDTCTRESSPEKVHRSHQANRILHTLTRSTMMRMCLFRFLAAFHKNKQIKPNKRVGCTFGFYRSGFHFLHTPKSTF